VSTSGSITSRMMALLGLIIEKVNGSRFEEFLARKIFNPLGMKNTRVNRVARHPAVELDLLPPLLLDLGNFVAPPDLYRDADLQPRAGLPEQRQRQPARHLPSLTDLRLAQLGLQIAFRP